MRFKTFTYYFTVDEDDPHRYLGSKEFLTFDNTGMDYTPALDEDMATHTAEQIVGQFGYYDKEDWPVLISLFNSEDPEEKSAGVYSVSRDLIHEFNAREL